MKKVISSCRGMHREIQWFTGDDMGVQGMTEVTVAHKGCAQGLTEDYRSNRGCVQGMIGKHRKNR